MERPQVLQASANGDVDFSKCKNALTDDGRLSAGSL